MGAKTGWTRLGLWTMGAEKCINRVSTLSLHISTQSLLLVGSKIVLHAIHHGIFTWFCCMNLQVGVVFLFAIVQKK